PTGRNGLRTDRMCARDGWHEAAERGTLDRVSDLSALGWLQFERLCAHVLQLEAGGEPSAWEGDAARPRGFVSNDPVKLDGHLMLPPVIVRCLWLQHND